jgi:predicted signal transduction protein with EAL and GGDEF domain
LEALPFAELKIDRQFVHGASSNPAKRAILTASIALAKALVMKVVAEGVERDEDWELLKRLKCDVVQGFIIARPMAPTALLDWSDHGAESATRSERRIDDASTTHKVATRGILSRLSPHARQSAPQAPPLLTRADSAWRPAACGCD